MAAHGGVEFGVDPGACLRAPVAARGAAGEPVIEHALMTEVLRASWLAAQPAAARSALRAGAGPAGAAGDPFRDWRGGAAVRHAMDPGSGFLWADFFVHDAAAPLRYARRRGFAVGRPVAEAWMAAAGVASIVRAHQHHDDAVKGDMLRALRGGRGLHDNWRGAGRVLTVISGAGVPYLGLPYDSFLALQLAGTAPRRWALQHCVGAVPPDAAGCAHDAAALAGIDCTQAPWTPRGADAVSDEGEGEGEL
jgi:hypothetical protein